MLLAYLKNSSFFAVGQALRAHHQTVQRCVERALAYGPMAALDDQPLSRKSQRSPQRPSIVNVAVLPQAKELVIRMNCVLRLSYPSMPSNMYQRIALVPLQAVHRTVCKILNEHK